MLGVGDHLLAKLASSGDLHAHEPLLEASMEMSGKLAPGWQSDHGVNAGSVCAIRSPGSVARCRVCRTSGWLAGVPSPCGRG